MTENEAIAEVLVAINKTVLDLKLDADSKTKANAIFRASLHLLAQQIALGIVQDKDQATDLNKVFSGLAVKIRSITETYVTTMKEARDVKADDSRH